MIISLPLRIPAVDFASRLLLRFPLLPDYEKSPKDFSLGLISILSAVYCINFY
jgi:hypothetical protein